jgi:hypothetical protein
MSEKISADLSVITPDYAGSERRSNVERRQRHDQRSAIRFDEKGGDRREGLARREDDEGLRFVD